MSQQNIDFGTFPDDPNADAIRTAFQKVQENFNQIFAATASQAVLSVNRLPGAGITVSAPTGNVIVTANIACVQFSTSTLSLGRAPTQSPTAQDSSITTSSQTMYINLPTTIANVDIIQLNQTLIANTVNVNLALNGNVGNFSGNVSGSNLTTGGILTVTGNANVGNVGAATGVFTSNVSVTSNVTAGNIYANSGTVGANTGAFANNITAGNVYANTGIIQAQYLKGDGSNVANVVALIAASIANGNSNVNIPSANGNVNISAIGNANILVVTGTGANITGTANVAGNLSAANANLGNLATANYYTGTLTTASQPNITSVGTLTGLGVNGTVTAVNITANTGVFTGNGNGLSQLVGANVTGTVANAAYANDAGNSANATTATTAGTVTTNAQPNITSVGTLSSLAVTGNTTSGNFVGVLANGNSNVSIPAANGNVNISAVGNANILVVTGTGANVTGYAWVTGLVTAGSGFNTGGNIIGGNVYANTGTIGASLLTGTLTTATQPNITSVGTLTGLGVNGTVTAVNITANTGVFTGNGNGLSQLVGANVTGTVANATYATSAGTAGTVTTAAQGNITSVGTLTGLGVNGTVTAVNITANTGVFTGNGNGLSQLVGANVTGTVANATYAVSAGSATTAGTVTTNAQPNITSTGTLSSLDVTANITAGNVYANSGTIKAQYLAGDGSNLTNISVGAGSYIVNGTSNVAVDVNANVNISVAGNANVVTVTGTGANINGYANVTGNINAPNVIATLLTGTLTTAAQPNITSHGTLTALNVNGISNLGPNGNVIITGGVSGAFLKTNGSGNLVWDTGTLNPAQGSNSQIIFNDGGTTYAGNANLTFNKTTGALTVGGNANVGNIGATNGVFSNVTGTLTTNAQPNITSVGTLSILTVSGNIGAGNITVGAGNITVTTGTMTANFFSGNANSLSNIPGANVTGQVSFAATANAVAGANVSGQVSFAATANAVAGANVSGTVSSATTAGTVTTAAQPNITSVGTLANLNVTSYIYVGSGAFVSSTTSTIQTSGDVSLLGSSAQSLVFSGYYSTNWKYGTTGQYIGAIRFDSANGKMQFFGSNSSGTAGANADIATRMTIDANGNVGIGTAFPASTLSVNGNIAGGNLLGSHANGNSNVNIPAANGNVNITAVGNTTMIITGTGANITGTLNATGNANVGNLNASVNITANNLLLQGDGTDGYIRPTNSGSRLFLGANNTNYITLTALGNVGIGGSPSFKLDVIANANSSDAVIRSYNANTLANAAVAYQQQTTTVTGVMITDQTRMQFGTTTAHPVRVIANNATAMSILADGNVGIANTSPTHTLSVTGTTNISGNLTAGNLIGPHANGNSNVNIPAINGNVNITAVGNATMIVTGTGANITGTLNATGNANVGNIGAAAGVFTTVAGNLITAAQPDITSIGTLTGLTVSGSTSLSSSPGTGTVLIGGYAQLPSASSEVGIKFSGGGVQFGLAMQPITDSTTFMSFFNAANTLVGSITQTASNVTWNGLVTGSNVTGTVSSATTAGTVTTAAQPNITSVTTSGGTFTVGNISNGGSYSGPGSIIYNSYTGAAEGPQIILAWTGVSGISGQANSTWNMDIDGSNNYRLFYQNASGGIGVPITAYSANATVAVGGALTVATTANVTGNLTAGNVIATSFHVHGVATGISAAGTVQANATALTKDFNVVSTVTAGQGVSLPTAVAGYRITIINTSANALAVYPLGNGIINSGAANAAYSQPAGARLDFICTTATTAPGGQWYTLNATYG